MRVGFVAKRIFDPNFFLGLYANTVGHKKKKSKLLKKWKEIKKDKKLRASPKYTELAAVKRIKVTDLDHPRDRSIVNLLSEERNVFKKDVVTIIGDGLIRALRASDDGKLPSTREGPIFVPSAGVRLSMAQRVLLNGFPSDLATKTAGLPQSDEQALLAATFPVPLIRSVMHVALGMCERYA